MGRYIRYWYTYRTVVAVLIALVLSGSIYWLYSQQLACDSHVGSCLVNISIHPEDRFMGYGKPDPGVVIVGIDNQSVKTIGSYPVPRSVYAQALENLEKDGALVVAFDVGFTDPGDACSSATGTAATCDTDKVFAKALAASTVPVVLSYEGDGFYVDKGSSSSARPRQGPARGSIKSP